MNSYEQLRNRQQEEFNAFPLGAAFSDKQFAEMMEKWGLTVNDTDKIYSIGAGCFIRRTDSDAFHELTERHAKEHEEAMAADETGLGYIKDMFACELANHEYCITYDYEETFDALCLTEEQVYADKRLTHGLEKARKDYLANCD